MCIGVVSKDFKYNHKKVWVGAQHTWGYIMGTGGKTNNSGKSAKFGDKYNEGDVIGVLMDFDNHTVLLFFIFFFSFLLFTFHFFICKL